MVEFAVFFGERMKTVNKGGRPPYQPTDKDRQMVEVLSGFAIPMDKIAMVLGTALDELERSGKGTALINLCVGAGMGTGIIIERV